MRHKKSFFTKNNSLNRVGGSQEKKAGLLEESFLDPNTLLEYEKQIPGFAEKLFELAKADQHHMQQIEKIRNNMTQNAMRLFIKNFRKKLPEKSLKNIQGTGYRLVRD